MAERLVKGDIKRIQDYIKKADIHEEKYLNTSKVFRQEFFVDYNKKINNNIFHDSGRIKDFRDFKHRVTERVDAIFETVVYHPDDGDLKLVKESCKKHIGFIEFQDFNNKEELKKKLEGSTIFLIGVVANFFGGISHPLQINEMCEKFIKEHKRKNKNNVIFLSMLRNMGMCRHRSILFKVLCDHVGIPCRILRGRIEYNGLKEDHMWNEVQIVKEDRTVDCMNFETFVAADFVKKHYRNLGHSRKVIEKNLVTIENLKKEYLKLAKKKIGGGGYSIVNHITFDVITEFRDSNDFKTETRNLAVKEVNVSEINRETKIDCEKFIKREIEMMTMLQHPNIVEIIGSFSEEVDYDQHAFIVMNNYEFNSLKFMSLFEEKRIGSELNDTQRTIEILILLMEVAKGLAFIHSFGVIHFDIKPKNILLNWDKRQNRVMDVRIADFGSSKGKDYHRFLTTVPATTEKYEAPEIRRIREDPSFSISFSPKSDVYSYGVFFEQFETFYRGIPKMEILAKKLTAEQPSERPGLDKVVNKIKDVLARALLQQQFKRSRPKNNPFVQNMIRSHGGPLRRPFSMINMKKPNNKPFPSGKKETKGMLQMMNRHHSVGRMNKEVVREVYDNSFEELDLEDVQHVSTSDDEEEGEIHEITSGFDAEMKEEEEEEISMGGMFQNEVEEEEQEQEEEIRMGGMVQNEVVEEEVSSMMDEMPQGAENLVVGNKEPVKDSLTFKLKDEVNEDKDDDDSNVVAVETQSSMPKPATENIIPEKVEVEEATTNCQGSTTVVRVVEAPAPVRPLDTEGNPNCGFWFYFVNKRFGIVHASSDHKSGKDCMAMCGIETRAVPEYQWKFEQDRKLILNKRYDQFFADYGKKKGKCNVCCTAQGHTNYIGNDAKYFMWTLIPNGDGYFKIVNDLYGQLFCSDVEDFTNSRKRKKRKKKFRKHTLSSKRFLKKLMLRTYPGKNGEETDDEFLWKFLPV